MLYFLKIAAFNTKKNVASHYNKQTIVLEELWNSTIITKSFQKKNLIIEYIKYYVFANVNNPFNMSNFFYKINSTFKIIGIK